ncbi:hypothetical protein H9L10_02675 [Phycicoccus endophyticus]|uniref:Uncharacterized protein n=1 Tax=Phycicoccus endophyticus TaxID=1690220 RepID=A0A7G9R326_9MICO|nr:hypothetical protein [Phycicoccus endophyticus]NHI20296.1 hypothetical protein [Phycicoccus endophyticus]QNN50001.1 hypothetical protein H9L10_02675 [Phycicoccus endophyticus]GGL28959.1 hypothetical protein GCM10012283_09010 [Phycicoccus endophyticus]
MSRGIALCLSSSLLVLALAACSTTEDLPDPTRTADSGSATASATPTEQSPTPSESSPSPSPSESATESEEPVATDEPTRPGGTGDGSSEVTVVLTRHGVRDGEFVVGGYADGVTTGGGTCTATLTSGQRTLTASGPAATSASTTSCGEGLAFDLEQATGTWQLVLSFTSATASGRSSATTVEVP